MAEHPVPSSARASSCAAASTPHVHVAPDFAPRRITDVELARRCLELGLAGFGLKSHYTATAERAAVVTEAVPGVHGAGHDHAQPRRRRAQRRWRSRSRRARARGSCGFPTVSSVNEQARSSTPTRTARCRCGCASSSTLREAGAAPASRCRSSTTAARRCPRLLEVLEVVARHDLVLATGHLSRDEIFTRRRRRGRRRRASTIVVTHPEFPSQRIAAADQVALAERGALMERALHDAVHRQGTVGARRSRRRARSAPRAPCGAPTSGRCSTRRSRTGWPSWPTASWRPASARRRSARWRSRTPAGVAGVA